MEKYQPSNGTEGMFFIEKYCFNCIHEKFSHTQDHNDKKCDILSNTMIYDVKDPKYPEEWCYDENDTPCCTAFSKWDWGNDEGRLNDPPPQYPDDPNQLCMPFIMDEIGVPKTKLNYQL